MKNLRRPRKDCAAGCAFAQKTPLFARLGRGILFDRERMEVTPMFGRHRTDVIVAGAGPTGLLTALRLADLGVHVEVLEEEPRSAGHSYALALHPGSVALLDEVGLKQEAIAAGRRLTGLAIHEGTERRATVPLGDAGTPALALPQSALETLLADRLAKRGVKVHWSHRLARLEPGMDGLTAVVHRLERDSTGYAVARSDWVIAKEIRFEAAYVIGADGHASLVRRALDIPFEEVAPSQVFACFECAPKGGALEEIRLVFAEPEAGTVNALWPLPGGRARWSLELDAPEVNASERFKSRLVTQMGERFFHHLGERDVRRLVAARAPWFDFDPDTFGWSIEVRFERRLAASFGRDRVWLAGDAAHLTGPAGMQSMNAGLREGSELAAHVKAILGDGASPDRLDAWGRERMAEWRFLLGLAGGLQPGAGAMPFIARNAARLLACLPGTGPGLDALATAVGLRAVRT
jgi:2-polyprenyl-6-methoxyphenol hydroxylase-like FAD-dependent oxidoreductase